MHPLSLYIDVQDTSCHLSREVIILIPPCHVIKMFELILNQRDQLHTVSVIGTLKYICFSVGHVTVGSHMFVFELLEIGIVSIIKCQQKHPLKILNLKKRGRRVVVVEIV